MKDVFLRLLLVSIFFPLQVLAEPDAQGRGGSAVQGKTEEKIKFPLPNTNSVGELTEVVGSCHRSVERGVSGICDAEKNPKLAAAGDIVSGLSSTAGTMGLSETCSSLSKALRTVSAATVAFKAGCEGVHTFCTDYCSSAIEKTIAVLKADKAKLKGLEAEKSRIEAEEKSKLFAQGLDQNYNGIISEIDHININRTPQAKKVLSILKKQGLKACEKFAVNMERASLDLVGLARSYQGAQNCKEQTKSDGGGGILDCTDPMNSTNVTCICTKNPRDPLCTNPTTKPEGTFKNPTADLGGDVDLNKINNDMNSLGNDPYGAGGSLGGPFGEKGNGDASRQAIGTSGGSGAPGGGGGGSGKSSYGSSSGGGGSTGSNPSVSMGFEGSGRGGSSSGYGGYRGSSNKYKGYGKNNRRRMNLKAYLPGGSKYKKRKVANVREISAANGPTLWEKVSMRYRRKLGTLLK